MAARTCPTVKCILASPTQKHSAIPMKVTVQVKKSISHRQHNPDGNATQYIERIASARYAQRMSHGRSSGTSSIVIDFHVHAFPDNLQLPTLPGPLATMPEKLGRLRRTARSWVKPVASSLHRAQTLMRHLPQPLLEGMDELTGVVPIAGLLFESSVSDLLEGMEDNEIDQAILIAHPPRHYERARDRSRPKRFSPHPGREHRQKHGQARSRA